MKGLNEYSPALQPEIRKLREETAKRVKKPHELGADELFRLEDEEADLERAFLRRTEIEHNERESKAREQEVLADLAREESEREQWKALLASETPEQREDRRARERKEPPKVRPENKKRGYWLLREEIVKRRRAEQERVKA